MKKIIISTLFVCLSTIAFTKEIRILFPNKDGCSGSWLLLDIDNWQLTGWGTYNHCNLTSEPLKQITGDKVITQIEGEETITEQPLTTDLKIPTKEDVLKLEKKSTGIKIYPNPSTSNRLIFESSDKTNGVVIYSIIGFDGKEYIKGKSEANKGNFSFDATNLKAGTYFIIATTGNKTQSANFVISK